ncbi:acyl-CoA dehydrogenase family protein [Streptomyces sp. NPDC048111]|uniref:acyl-CoA dehydrogenase family protein n=1 Tax=Streptomyces sp. NPDC048111 TaxID=3365500 RepID=UPI003723F6B8
MDFSWTERQQAAHDRVLAGARALGAPGPAAPADLRERWAACAALGLTGLSVPEELGGQGYDALTTAHVVEAAGRGCPDMGLLFAVTAHLFATVMPIVEHGDKALREEVVPRLADGTWIGANAITEQEAGSDVTALRTTAVRHDGHYVLNGTKTFVSNAPAADLLLVYAVTDPAFGFLGVTCFAVDRDTPGVTVGAPFDKPTLDSCPAATVTFTDARVPASRVVGQPGQGAAIFQSSMRWERTCLFAGYLGQMARLTDEAVQHALDRRQFGHPIAANQAVSHRIADMRLRLETARLLLHRTCWLMDRGEHTPLDIALAKLHTAESAVQTALDATQLFAGSAYSTRTDIARALGDALPARTFSGTSDIQRELIAKGLGL